MFIDMLKKSRIIYLSICLLLVLTFTITYIYTSNRTKSTKMVPKFQSYEMQNKLQMNSELDTPVKSVASTKTISINGNIIKRTKYLICGHTIEETIPKDSGIDYNKLTEMYPDWTIDKFSDNEVIISKQINEKCPNHYIIKDVDSKVVVYYQEPQNGIDIKEITNISTQDLSEDNQQRLKSGIFADSNERLAEILEDIGS